MQQPLLNVNTALKTLLAMTPVNRASHFVATVDGLNQILAKSVRADINVPGFNNSAMDGYAIALKPNQINTSALTFAIKGKIAAGDAGMTITPGTCAQIFTGASIPKGANTVVMQEQCELCDDGKKIKIDTPIKKNQNMRSKGGDIKKGEVILPAGKQLKPVDIALAASVGATKLSVFNKVKVGIFFTGNELVEPGNILSSGQIFSSNRYALLAALKNLNCEITDLGNIKDSFSATCASLESLKKSCELIITTGGVSVGEKDYVKPALEKLGKLSLWKIKMKPGKPFAFGHIGNTAFMGLPGNPVSAIVTFLLFARPFIKKMQGERSFHNKTIKVRANFDCCEKKIRREFARARLDFSAVPPLANLYPKQDSNVLSSLVWADGLIEIPEQTTFAKGKILNFYPLNL